ncbi:MAG: TIGR04282 family arsenosugar biosynthesis glycosyltransferase [Balneolaceae bacterium]|nr:TIGR04282 family arsenosugar biosynthesis glycosyltransferase [Balneolaceae bacterium]
MREERLLMVFAKRPEAGRVKTRLAEEVGEKKAVEIYRRLLARTREVCLEVPVRRQAWFDGDLGEESPWGPPHFECRVQPEGDLGARMSHAFRMAEEEGPRQALLIGSDCADLRADHLRRAFEALERHDLVLGPASDGGYWLVGARAWHPELFRGIPWSTSDVLARTLQKAESLGLRTRRLEELGDVDTAENWQRARRRHDYLS